MTRLVLGALVSTLLLAVPASAGTPFTGALDQDRHKAGNWTNGVPTASEEAIVPVARTATLTAAGTANSVTLESGGQLIVNAALNVDGGAPSNFSGTLSVERRRQHDGAFGLPSARRCASRRRFPITISPPRNVTIRSARVQLNGKRVRVRRSGSRFKATIDLRGLPKGTFRVTIRITTGTGRRLTGQRRYRTCVPRR